MSSRSQPSLPVAPLSDVRDELLHRTRLVLRRKVRIPKSHRNRPVPEQFANCVEIDARHYQLAGEQVTQIVEAERA